MSSLVEEALRLLLVDSSAQVADMAGDMTEIQPGRKIQGAIWLPGWNSGGHLVDISDREALYEAMGVDVIYGSHLNSDGKV